MKKKNKNGYIQMFLENWKDPKTRSIIILSLYILGFLLLFGYSAIANAFRSSREPSVSMDAITKLSVIDNYEYVYDVSATTSNGVFSYDIEGIRYSDNDNFKVLGKDFYIKDNVIYGVIENDNIKDLVQFDLLLIRPDSIYNYLKNADLVNKIEYGTGDKKSIYTIPVSMFNIANLDIPTDNTDTVEIVIYEDSKYVNKIEIDIYNLMKIGINDLSSYDITINYDNVNNIRSVES